MFRRLGYGIELTKQSFRVLRLDKELLLFPLMSAIACMLVAASFVAPLWGSGYLSAVAENGSPGPIGYAVLLCFYVCVYFVIVFFNSAIVECAIIRFRGGDPSLVDGLKGSCRRLPQILGWALVAATVGMILRTIEERSGIIGKIIAAVFGLAWSAATFFVVPVIVMERLGPIDAAKRSTQLVKKNWGEAVGAHLGVGAVAFLLYMACTALLVVGISMMSTPAIGGTLIALAILSYILVALATSAVSAIVIGALYMYAGQGTVPDQFEKQTLDRVFSK
jgi:hypothetical protein